MKIKNDNKWDNNTTLLPFVGKEWDTLEFYIRAMGLVSLSSQKLDDNYFPCKLANMHCCFRNVVMQNE